jgi:hypothetical protein
VFKKSLKELVQALQIAAFWYCMPRHHVPISMFHLIQLATTISTEIGMGESISSTSKEISTGKHLNACDAWRTRITSYLYSAYMGLLRRTPHILTWDTLREESLIWLEYSVYGLATDVLLCQIVRIIRICEQISSTQNLAETNTITNISEPTTQTNITNLSNLIADWKGQIPALIQCPLLKIWEHISHILIHESVLHTPTNKDSFTAPYLAELLSVTNFPAPTPVTSEQVISLHTLKANCQALLDLVLDLESILSWDFLLFS